MARRSAPPHSGPSYLPPSSHSVAAQNPMEIDYPKFRQIFAPEKMVGNISIVIGVGMFLGGITAVRLWGEALVGDI
ncbi:hypothetical protein JB92DRAFT_2694600 [Gautieria morchelliformis]|nr:hypothetical protein JB92DRAFT_2694600 [Gautieria morchelliformis]